MKPSTYRLLSIIGSVFLLIAAVVVYSKLVNPAYDEIQQLRDKREANIKLLQEQNDAILEVKRLLNEYQSLTQIQENISLALPNEEEVPSIINQLQGLAKINSLDIESLSLQYPPLKSSAVDSLTEPLGTIRVTMRLSGDYRNLRPYLENLETNIRLIDVYSLNIEGGAIPGKTKLIYNLVLDTYYQ